ncbi:ubiquitin-like modifier-activating enzyme ATG7 [Nilaparvata lugens]|uniref:ubiquitin-like modifier-activating enzyme ATG7 n=1 Tax=Nilaparvata lugens TaxID=108931 RepID=UPI00193E46EC|nr:ubiquitin-like modifier-activating enzyme ATG7 [Nilaparvata lugens]
MEESAKEVLKFSSLSSSIEPGFWYKLAELKLEVDKLDEHERKIWGSYKKIGGKSLFTVGLSSFNKSISIPENCLYTNVARGYCINKNTLESYKSCDKTDLVSMYGQRLKKQMCNGDVLDDPSLLSSFILLSHADLKKYNFIYWFAFLVPQDITINSIGSNPLEAEFTTDMISDIFFGHSQLDVINRTFFVVVKTIDGIKVYTLKEFSSSFKNGELDKLCYYFAFCDCSSDSKNPSWYLRNYLAFIHLQFSNKSMKVICIRDKETSYALQVTIEGGNSLEKWIGWKRKSDGKFGPVLVNLGDSMDPARLAENGKRLNLSLMKWRLAPELNLDIVRNTSFLLLGSGTLGCSVALNLTAWGADKITFVDSGRVSYSNPPRQFLFSFEDSRSNVHKAHAAAKRLNCISPSMEARSEVLEIPMPGHATSDIAFKLKGSDVFPSDHLSQLISEHDVIFLLTDTRESRWLPTLLARHHKKLEVISCSNGENERLKTLPLRKPHKMKSQANEGAMESFYFERSNDSKKRYQNVIRIDSDCLSTADRTLDQQCTVTRPGVASLAAALAVELTVSILQHPKRDACDSADETVLGAIPHSIRGYLSSFSHILPSTPAFESCVACSTKVLSAYEKEGRLFLKKVYESSTYLENLTGISKLLDDPNINEIVELDDEEDF